MCAHATVKSCGPERAYLLGMTELTHRPQAVFFDYGDTLERSVPPYLHRVAHALQRSGIPVDEDAVELAAHDATYAWYCAWRRGEVPPDADALLTWARFLFQALDLPLDLMSQRPEILGHAITLTQDRELRLFPGTTELLQALRGRGYRLGIISNNDGTCAEKCEQLGIAEYFEVIVDSGIEMVSKPAAEIFTRACGYLGVLPDAAVHVGDMFGADVCGAADAGLQTIWMNFRGFPIPDGERATVEVRTIGDVAGCLP